MSLWAWIMGINKKWKPDEINKTMESMPIDLDPDEHTKVDPKGLDLTFLTKDKPAVKYAHEPKEDEPRIIVTGMDIAEEDDNGVA